ncbi:MAG: 30S ribosome-binding factor RbfA [Bacteroidetes bacterium]|nr:30S ribosome-binding factor RbfA [Bacteroidota bacterium]MBS1740896.1 30S ribosome-binding factor RbfA [Bacteroidota bacterium]MBS1775197.1 30S ribosome-binding factor RbfA [Bacteroidota bacterium]
MEESKRQKQVGKLVMEELSDIFQREGYNVKDGGMISISKVTMTPDLLEARVYLSLFQIKEPSEFLKHIKEKGWEFRKMLGARLKNQLRRVPELHFFNDDTLDYVFKMEGLFKQINEERSARESQSGQSTEPANDTE